MLRRLLLLMLCLPIYGQKIAGTGATGPNGAGIGRNGSTNWLYLPTDSSGNLMTNGTGSSGPPQIASKNATGPLGSLIGWYAAGSEWLYVPVDANGNLEVNCVTGCSGTGSGTVNSGTAGHLAYYPTTGTAVSSDPNLDDGVTQTAYLYYGGGGGIRALGSFVAGGNFITNGSVVQWGTNVVAYGGYGNGILAILNGSSTELTRLNFGTNTNASVALCSSGTTLAICGGDGSSVGTFSAPVLQSGNGATKTCGATIVVTNGIVTSC